MSKVLLIIPAYDEDGSILSTCQSILDYNKKHHTNYDFIVINDSSNDSTGKILDEAHLPHIDHIYNLGIGGAMQTGYKYARDYGYDIAIQFDGDGQHDINSVAALIQPIQEDQADLEEKDITKGKNLPCQAREPGEVNFARHLPVVSASKLYPII